LPLSASSCSSTSEVLYGHVSEKTSSPSDRPKRAAFAKSYTGRSVGRRDRADVCREECWVDVRGSNTRPCVMADGGFTAARAVLSASFAIRLICAQRSLLFCATHATLGAASVHRNNRPAPGPQPSFGLSALSNSPPPGCPAAGFEKSLQKDSRSGALSQAVDHWFRQRIDNQASTQMSQINAVQGLG